MPSERVPLLRVAVAGAELPGAIAVDIHTNNHLAADRFRARFAATLVPEEALHRPGVRVHISVALDEEWTTVLIGTIDSVCLDPISGTLDVEGRDLSSLFIETRVDETFANRTSSEIAATLAGRHGLLAAVEHTSTPVGRYYQSEHDRIMLGQFAKAMTEWDLLAFLARQEGFDLFMEGETLTFASSKAQSATPLRKEQCISLQLEHSVGLGRQIEVTVRSWGTKSGTAVAETVRGGGAGPLWTHAITRPNLTGAEARTLAERILADLVRHEWSGAATMPGELSLSARSRVAIVGTGTAWDREYRVSELTRHLDARRGFTQRLCLQGFP